jgi:hypothetical protein
LRCPDCQYDQVHSTPAVVGHCPKCQTNAARRWLKAHQANLLPVDYYYVVFTLSVRISLFPVLFLTKWSL